MIRFTLPNWPPSVNDSHFSRFRRLKPATRIWIEQATAALIAQRGRIRFKKDAELAIAIRLYGRWKTTTKGAGAWKRIDVSNRIKILEDVVADVCGVNDCQVTKLSAEKVESDAPRTDVDIWDRGEMP